MDLFVINLDRNPERLREFERVNPHLADATRFPAVDGAKVNRAELIAQKVFEEPLFYSDGAIGNALSHLKLWEKTVKRNAIATVLEDDALVHKDFETLAPPLIAGLPGDWDIAVWGWNFDSAMSFDVFPGVACVARFSQNEMRREGQAIQQGAAQPHMHRLHYAFGTVGYSLSPAGAKKLAARAVPIAPFLYRIPALDLEVPNEAMDCVMASLYEGLNAYVCFPPLVLTRNERATSTVQAKGKAAAEASFKLTREANYLDSRKFKRKYARYLSQQGNRRGAARWYLKYLTTGTGP